MKVNFKMLKQVNSSVRIPKGIQQGQRITNREFYSSKQNYNKLVSL